MFAKLVELDPLLLNFAKDQLIVRRKWLGYMKMYHIKRLPNAIFNTPPYVNSRTHVEKLRPEA